MQDSKLIELIYYLTGEIKDAVAAAYNGNKEKLIPLCDPISTYLNEVNRFMFGGGVGVDIVDAGTDDPRQIYLDQTIYRTRLQSKLFELWKHGAITGEILATPRLSEAGYHLIDFYKGTEFKPEYDGDRLTEIYISTIRYKEIDGKMEPCRFRKEIDAEKITDYPLVPIARESNFNWEAAKIETPHQYREIPALVIKNNYALNQTRGAGEFDYAAVKIASAAAMLAFDAIENAHFFGSPIIDSPTAKETVKRLNERVRVLQKLGADEGGGHDLLTPTPISSQHLELMEVIEQNFRRHMGIRAGQQTNTTDTSSLTLKILNANTISKAESKWLNYVDNGLNPLFQLVLRMAAIDGILSAVSVGDESSYALQIYRLKPYFSPSPQEMLQLAQVAIARMDLGLDRSQVIHELIYPDLPLDEIEARLRPNLEDL